MGRQSSRLYFQGKDHKDIYFQGHYHDAMYLSDSEGNVTLVWEKLKKTLDVKTFLLTYDGDLYIATISRIIQNTNTLFYSGNDIYNMEANTIKGPYTGAKTPISMFIFKEKLEIVFERSYYGVESYSIPLLSKEIDTDNAILNELEGYYWYTDTILVGKTCKKYQASLYNSNTNIAMRAGITINGRAISYGEDFEFVSYGVFFVAEKIFVNAYAITDIDNPILFLELNDEETELVPRGVSLPTDFVQDFKLDAINAYLEYSPTANPDRLIYTFRMYSNNEFSAGVNIINDTIGTVYIDYIQAKFDRFAYRVQNYKAIIDFSKFKIISFEKVEYPVIYQGQGFNQNWRVQFARVASSGATMLHLFDLTYGRISSASDKHIHLYEIEGMADIDHPSDYYNGCVSCIAEIGDFLYIGTRNSGRTDMGSVNGYYICVNTKKNTAKLTEFYIGIKE